MPNVPDPPAPRHPTFTAVMLRALYDDFARWAHERGLELDQIPGGDPDTYVVVPRYVPPRPGVTAL